MLCPHCQQEHPTGIPFCPNTGRSLEIPPAAREPFDTQPGFEPPGLEPSPTGTERMAAPTRPMALVILLGVAGILMACLGAIILLTADYNFPSPAKWLFDRQTVVAAGEITDERKAQTSRAELRASTAASREKTQAASTQAPGRPGGNPTLARRPTQTLGPTPTQALAATRTLPPSPAPTFTQTPTPSPRFLYSGMIVYTYGGDNQREVFLLDPQTGRQQQVTSNQWREEGPSFSPDNSRMVYASYREEGWELYARDMQSGAETQITHFDGQARWPEWSPVLGDDRIVFEGRNDAGLGFIYVINADGSGLERLTDGGSESSPSWSPDGKQVVHGHSLIDTNGDGKVTASDTEDIFITTVETKATRPLTDTPGVDEILYVWSPDGRWIAVSEVAGDRDGNGYVNLDDARDIRLIAVEGSENRVLNTGGLSVFSPEWSPDGREIVLTADVGNQTEIWIYSLETGQSRRITGAGPYYHTEWAN